jgi:hypothetical protein
VALGIAEVVKEVDSMMRKITTQHSRAHTHTHKQHTHAHTNTRPWYVQPVDGAAQILDLKSGTCITIIDTIITIIYTNDAYILHIYWT